MSQSSRDEKRYDEADAIQIPADVGQVQADGALEDMRTYYLGKLARDIHIC